MSKLTLDKTMLRPTYTSVFDLEAFVSNSISKTELLYASDVQAYVCRSLTHPDAGSEVHAMYNLAFAVRVRPSVDLRRLRRAFATLQKRHDTFRCGFVLEKDVWRVEVHEAPRAIVQVHDLGTLDVDDQLDQIQLFMGWSPDLANDPMIRLDVLRFGTEGDVVLLQINHAVSDGFGCLVAFDDLIGSLMNIPAIRPAMSVTKYLNTLRVNAKTHDKKFREYWENLLLPVIPMPNCGRKAKGFDRALDPFEYRPSTIHSVDIDAYDTQLMRQACKDHGVTTYALLGGAFQQSIKQMYQSDSLYLTSMMGRNDANLRSYAGMHLDIFLNALRPEMGDTVLQQAVSLNAQMKETIAHLPFSGVGFEGDIAEKIRQKGGAARQFRLHLMQSEQRRKNAKFLGLFASGKQVNLFGRYIFETVDLPDDNLGKSELGIDKSDVGDGMRIGFDYLEESFEAKEIDELSKRLVSNLRAATR